MFDTYTFNTMNGEDLCEDFITAFREHNIQSWKRPMVTEYRDQIKAHGVHLGGGRGRNEKDELIGLLSRKDHAATGIKGKVQETQIYTIPTDVTNRGSIKLFVKEGQAEFEQQHDDEDEVEYMSEQYHTKEPMMSKKGAPDPGDSSTSKSNREKDQDWNEGPFIGYKTDRKIVTHIKSKIVHIPKTKDWGCRD